MTTEKMSVHKALCELKTLDSRIAKSMEGVSFVLNKKHSATTIKGKTISEVSSEIQANYQKICDLIKRRDALKRAVVLSNAVTKVNIGRKEYTVAEAIEMKNHGITFLNNLLTIMTYNYQTCQTEADRNNGTTLDIRADEYVKSLYGNTDMKNASDEIKKVRDDFITAQTMEIVDPIGCKKEMERLEKEINVFMVDVDSALSVSNALTEITIEY